MNLEERLEILTDAINNLNSTLMSYPSPVDSAIQSRVGKINTEELKEEKDEAPTTAPSVSKDDLAKLAVRAIQGNKEKNSKLIKDKLTELDIPKVTATPDDKLEEVHAFLKGLEV